jgi:hypothetical protein
MTSRGENSTKKLLFSCIDNADKVLGHKGRKRPMHSLSSLEVYRYPMMCTTVKAVGCVGLCWRIHKTAVHLNSVCDQIQDLQNC